MKMCSALGWLKNVRRGHKEIPAFPHPGVDGTFGFLSKRTNPTESCGSGNVQFIEIVLQPKTQNVGLSSGETLWPMGQKRLGYLSISGKSRLLLQFLEEQPFWQVFFSITLQSRVSESALGSTAVPLHGTKRCLSSDASFLCGWSCGRP